MTNYKNNIGLFKYGRMIETSNGAALYIRNISTYQLFFIIGLKGLLLSINFMNGTTKPECCGFVNFTQLSGTQAHTQINYSTNWMSISVGTYCGVYVYSNYNFSLSLN